MSSLRSVGLSVYTTGQLVHFTSIAEPIQIATPQTGDSRRLREFVTEQVGATHGDPGLEAVGLLAMVDGLMVHLLLAQTDPTTAVATIDYHLDRIFGAVGAGHDL